MPQNEPETIYTAKNEAAMYEAIVKMMGTSGQAQTSSAAASGLTVELRNRLSLAMYQQVTSKTPEAPGSTASSTAGVFNDREFPTFDLQDEEID